MQTVAVRHAAKHNIRHSLYCVQRMLCSILTRMLNSTCRFFFGENCSCKRNHVQCNLGSLYAGWDNFCRDYALPSGHEVIVGGGVGTMRGIKIPQQDFALKGRGAYARGGGGGICGTLWYIIILQFNCSQIWEWLRPKWQKCHSENHTHIYTYMWVAIRLLLPNVLCSSRTCMVSAPELCPKSPSEALLHVCLQWNWKRIQHLL